MKADKLKLIKKSLESERKKLSQAIEKITVSRDESPLPTESRSDTSRIQADKMLSELKERQRVLESLLHDLPANLPEDFKGIKTWSYVELKGEDKLLKIIIVPEGYGGMETDGITFVSEKTPLAKKITGKTEKSEIYVNEKNFVIVNLE